MTTYVLIHGGGLGGWTWQKVARMLEAKGHIVYAPSLTGCGERSHLVNDAVDMHTHVTDVANLLFYEDLSDVVLVGHSYGGVVITGAADRVGDRIAKLVYVDAPMGRSNAEAFPGILQERQFGRVVDGVELIVFPREDLVAFYGITDPAEVEWTMQRMTPQPWKCFEQKLELQNPSAVEAIPRYHIVASSSVEMGAHNNLAAGERVEGRYWQVDGGHDLMATSPNEVASLLTQIAGSEVSDAVAAPVLERSGAEAIG